MLVVFIGVLLALLLAFVKAARNYRKRHSLPAQKRCTNVKLCVVLGSGGHTTEMLALLEELSSSYSSRLYVVAKTDSLSVDKVLEIEEDRNGEFKFCFIGRSREVLQSYFTSVFTTVLACIESIRLVLRSKFDILVCNGPGTCIPVCFAVALFDLLRLRDTKIVYFESICRVKRLSLSGLILYHLQIPDLIAVHWTDLVEKYPRAKLINCLGKEGF